MESQNFDIRNQGRERDKDFEKALRPLCFDDFSGQDKIIENLRVFVAAARMRGEALDSDARQTSFTDMMEIALNVAVTMDSAE